MHITSTQSSGGSGTKIHSDLDITVKNWKGEALDGFTAQFIERPLPSALWGIYSPDDDPARTTNPANLRKPDSPTLTLAVGVTVSRPDDLDGLIFSGLQSFDPTIALRTALGPFDLAVSKPVESSFLAAPRGTPADAGNWDSFERDWVAAYGAAETIVGSEPGANGMLKMAGEWLGWNGGTASQSAGPGDAKKPSWMLDGRLPKGLLATLTTEYPVLPRECGVFS